MSTVERDCLERLEFRAIREALAERTQTSLGKERVQEARPFSTLSQAREQIDLITQMRGLLDKGESPPVAGTSDVRAALELGKKGVVLERLQLRTIGTTLERSSALHRFLVAREDTAPLLYGIGASMFDLEREANDIGRCFSPDGELVDEASPDLGPLRRRLRQLHEMVREKLEDLLRSPTLAPYLQESYFTMRADRYVLPIQASFQGEVKGIVHDASSSGHTVFIEPASVVELGNRLKIAQSAALAEEARILLGLTTIVVALAESIVANLVGVARTDFLVAAARLAQDLDAEPVIPVDAPSFDLIGARHPLLALKAKMQVNLHVVANDIGLATEQRALILTGPNTGGKTVAMKTVGLLALMAQAGLHIPADRRSRLGWFQQIDAAIGDDQSIASNLSTFAAHLGQIMRLMASARDGALILLDEIAADTDPTQGQALAQAILERLCDLGAHVIATTHFERLKALPFSDARFRNAGVGFDPERFVPTYKITLDVPQSSSGIDIAGSLGLDAKVVARARQLCGEGSVALEALMKGLREKQHEAERIRAKSEEALHRLVASRNEVEAKKRALEAELEKVMRAARIDLVEEVEKTRAEVRGIISKLQKAASAPAVREAMRMATEAAAELAHIESVQEQHIGPREIHAPAAEPMRVAVGDWVHVARLEKDGEVVLVDDQEVVVAVGSMRTRVATNALSAAKTKRPRATRSDSTIRRAASETRPARDESTPSQIDLRGQTVDEALARIDAFLDVHFQGSAFELRIVHGHGSGILRQSIREHLKRSGYVKKFRSGGETEGGDGVTVVEVA